jgi:hypothetical protein
MEITEARTEQIIWKIRNAEVAAEWARTAAANDAEACTFAFQRAIHTCECGIMVKGNFAIQHAEAHVAEAHRDQVVAEFWMAVNA